jgi:D-serine deaminase-like pyridoxal phosphate-dependent protein
VLNLVPRSAKERACHQALDLLQETRALLEREGLAVEIVSAGGTGSYEMAATHPAVTEIQAGGGIFMDAMYRQAFGVEDLECALTVLATVTSRGPDRAVLDAGFKTLSAHHHPPYPLGRDDLELRYLSAEHGLFAVKEGCPGPRLGERLELVVGYSDSTTFLHDCFLGLRQGRVEVVWPIEGRGCLT